MVKNAFILHMLDLYDQLTPVGGSTYPTTGVSWAILQIILEGHLKWNYWDLGDEQCTGTKISVHILYKSPRSWRSTSLV